MATYESRRYNTPVPDASKIADGSVNNTEFQHLDGVTSDIQTQFTSLDNGKLNLSGGSLTGDITTNSNINLGDSDNVIFGAGQDMKLFSDGTVGYVYANDLRLQSMTGENYVTAAVNGGANLFYDNANKLQTTASGIGVTGEVSATGNIVGNGQHLTNLNGSNISSGTVADARISTLTASKLTGALPAIDGSNLTGINVAPSTATSVGALKYFAIYYKGSGGASNSLVIGVGTEIAPASYESSNMYVTSTGLEYKRTQNTTGSNDPTTLGYILPGFAANLAHISGKTRATESGTWRCISQAIYNYYSTTGNQGSNYGVSAGGLFQRIS
jgi:hypothetical protein